MQTIQLQLNRWWQAILAAVLCGVATGHGAEFGHRLVNLSTRAHVAAADGALIAGFVVGEGGPKTVLIRAAGPALAAYGVPGVLSDPRIVVVDSAQREIASNDNWVPASGPAADAVGAFPFPPGSRDAALVATLTPGVYTAIVTGTGGGTGAALVEVYDLTGSARLINLSTRAMVGAGEQGLVIAGLVVPQTSGARRLLVRAAGPALTPLGVAGALSDPWLRVLDGTGRVLHENDNWGGGAELAARFAEAGAFPFAPDSRDGALFVELPPGAYTLHVGGVGGAQGVALVEVYDLTPPALEIVVAATVAATDTLGAPPAVFTFTRSGDTSAPRAFDYAVGGSGVAERDFDSLPGRAEFPAGVASVTVPVVARGHGAGAAERTVTVTLPADPALPGAPAPSATVRLLWGEERLFIAQLRPPAGSTSTAYGTATLQLSPSGGSARVSVSFANLSSPQVTNHLALGGPGDEGPYVLGLPTGPIENRPWTLRATGVYSAADVLAALLAGRIYVSVDTVTHPQGELRGQFIRASGSQLFTPPPAPAPWPGGPTSDFEAARFLQQTTFGPTAAAIAEVRAKGFAQWLDEQLALPPTLHRPAVLADFAAVPSGGQNNNTRPGRAHRQAAWWHIAVHAPDQLRQRVAFALSQLFVVSEDNGTINNTQEGAAHYYDHLVRGAFGNFRDLLEEVTLSPIMGTYLSHLRNAKANPQTGALPDENFAREIMQLFTIGLHLLQPDGTLRLDTAGAPIPTYDQATVVEMARVFTGWGFHSTAANPNFRNAPANWFERMQAYPSFHDTGAKAIVASRVLPAGQTAVEDLRDTLDTLFHHPNAAPFFARHLLQRLITSNPSPGYVYRVAQVFADDGRGGRGNLGAVVRAALLDPEARAPGFAANPGFGKPKEPVLRVSALLRALESRGDASGRFNLSGAPGALEQAALRAPTVFNFFEPNYVHPGPLAEAGLFAPELQIATATTAITVPNYLYNLLFTAPNGVTLDLTPLLALADRPEAVLDRLELLLCAGPLPASARDRILSAWRALPASASATDRVRTAAYLVVVSPEAAVQK
jgi:uncharacterized protein (DUF1800 family)